MFIQTLLCFCSLATLSLRSPSFLHARCLLVIIIEAAAAAAHHLGEKLWMGSSITASHIDSNELYERIAPYIIVAFRWSRFVVMLPAAYTLLEWARTILSN